MNEHINTQNATVTIHQNYEQSHHGERFVQGEGHTVYDISAEDTLIMPVMPPKQQVRETHAALDAWLDQPANTRAGRSRQQFMGLHH